jgi:hypothetical protein
MNKTFILTLLLGFFVLSVFGVSGVFAVDQSLNVSIGENITVQIAPETVQFGQVAPGSNNNMATNGPIAFNATGSNVDVNIEVTNVTGFPFENGLMLDGSPALGEVWDLLCILNGGICTYAGAETVPTLDVPIGAPAGVVGGTTTYTITGPTP